MDNLEEKLVQFIEIQKSCKCAVIENINRIQINKEIKFLIKFLTAKESFRPNNLNSEV